MKLDGISKEELEKARLAAKQDMEDDNGKVRNKKSRRASKQTLSSPGTGSKMEREES